MTDITIPNVGESVSEVTIAQWFKAVGDTVKKDEPLVELETDKAAQELVSPEDGVLEEILVAEGENAEVGKLIAKLGSGSGAAKTEPAAKAEVPEAASGGSAMNIDVPNVGESVSEVLVAEGDVAKVGQTIATLLAGASGGSAAAAPSESASAPATSDDTKIMPAAAKIIRENGLDASLIKGTGKDGRITKADALAAKTNPPKAAPAPAAKAAPAAPKAPRDTGPREDRVRMTRIRQTIARRLKDAQNTAAMLTTYNEADMSAIMAMRSQYKELFIKRHGVKLGFMSFFVKACVQALKDVPSVNAEIDGTDIIYKNFYDISIAVGTDKGLVVPVLRDCDELSLGGIEKGIGALGVKARDGKLSMDDMSGGTFTISNGGVYGSLMSSPILNPPQSGILGMHKIEKRPVVVNDEIVIRPMMYLALSYDHRIVDGKEAVTFLVRVKECLEDPERMLLDL